MPQVKATLDNGVYEFEDIDDVQVDGSFVRLVSGNTTYLLNMAKVVMLENTGF